MKRSFAFIALCILLGFTANMVGAQTAAAPSKAAENLYIKTVYINKIYPHAQGYKITYWTGDGKIGTTYVPIAWFIGSGNKGEILRIFHKSVPYMEIVYNGGKFKMIRLFVSPAMEDISWGVLPNTEDPSDKFKIETLDITY